MNMHILIFIFPLSTGKIAANVYILILINHFYSASI